MKTVPRARLWSTVVGAAAVAVAVAVAPTASARPAPIAAQQADRAVAALARSAPQAAAVPNGRVATIAGGRLAAPGTVVTTVTSDCSKQQALLAAGRIRSYKCTQAHVVVDGTPSLNPAVTWPSACSSGSGTLTGWLAVDRRNACDHVEIDIVTTLEPSGEVIGTTDMHAVNMMTASTSQARWASSSYLWVWSYTGVGFPEYADGSLFPSCPGSGVGCLGTGGTWTPLSDGASWRGTGNVDVSGLTSGKIANNVAGFWEYTMDGADWGNPVTVDSYLALSRCDNATAGTSTPGCVFSNIAGVLGFSQSTVPDFVNHIYQAQLSGLKGRLSTGTYLTRLTDSTLINKNGSKACPTSLTRPSGKSCDEYPFRSTYEGASTSGATLARSFPGCSMPDPQRTGSSGWSRCFIPSGQNSSAGGTTGAFYRSQRMLAHDAFQIGYLP